MDSQIKHQFHKEIDKARLCQGDILHDVEFAFHSGYEGDGSAEISKKNLEYCVVINQECDLDLDYKNRAQQPVKNHDKYIPTILLLPAYRAIQLKDGKHLDILKGEIWNSDQFKGIKQNNNQRFHYIDENNDFQIPELVIDFKHIYAVNREVLYQRIGKVYYASISELYRESLSQRYTHYLSRIGLPEIN